MPSLKRELIQDHHNLGGLLGYQGRTAEAVRNYRESLKLEASFPRKTADDWFHSAGLRALCARPAVDGPAPPSAAERAECRRHADEAIAALRRAIAAGFNNADAIRFDDALSTVRDRDDFRAILAQAEATATGRATSPVPTPAPSDSNLPPRAGPPMVAHAKGRSEDHLDDGRDRRRSEMASGEHAIGVAQLELGQFEDAKATLGRVLATREALVRDHPGNVRYRADLAAIRTAIARLEWRTDRLDAAIRSWDEIRQDLESDLDGRPNDPVLAEVLIELETTVGHSYAEAALWDEANAALAGGPARVEGSPPGRLSR